MRSELARDFWRVLEPLAIVMAFAPDCIAALQDTGLKGRWMPYFAARTAPLGAVGPAVVEATYYGFHPRLVRRSIPDAWELATPAAVLAARKTSAAGVLRKSVPGIEEAAAVVLPDLRQAIEAADPAGRPLFAANRALGRDDDPVAELWQAATTLREHRGDGHNGCLIAEGIDGAESIVLFATDLGAPPQFWQGMRGWTEEEWAAAEHRLTERGLLGADGLTPAGRALRAHVEDRTDVLAARPFAGVADPVALLRALKPLGQAVFDAGQIPRQNLLGVNLDDVVL